MMAEIVVSHGLCTAIRPKVLTALEPYKFKRMRVQAWGEGRYGTDDQHTLKPDNDRMAAKHYARITVSDDAVKWAEWLLWQSGHFVLESKPLNPRLNWVAPLDCKQQSRLGRGTMPTPWSEKKRKPRRQPTRNGFSLAGILRALVPQRRQKRQRRSR